WTNFWKRGNDADSEEVKNYMLDKFETEVMSRAQLQAAIDSALNQYRDDILAARNRLVADMRLALTTSDVPRDFPDPDFDSFLRDFQDHVAGDLKAQGSGTIVSALVEFTASTV